MINCILVAKKRDIVINQGPLIKALNGITPRIGEDCFIAPNATLVGDVEIGNNCSIWYQAVLRGDVGKIQIGDHSNVQDGAIIHATYGKSNSIIGNRVTVGHRAIIHGCIIHDDVLIGMGAIIMDNAIIESGAIVAAGAVVLANTVVTRGSIWAGVPAVKVKDLDPEKSIASMQKLAQAYIGYKAWYD